MSKSKDTDDYIARQVKEARPILEELREIIKSTIPQIEEEILWGYPFYKYHGILAGITAYKKHVSFQVADTLSSEDRKTLEEKGLKIDSASLDYVAKEEITISEREKEQADKLFEALDDNDAINNIYSNIKN